MPVHGYGNQIHQRRAYDYPQETARDMARALRMTIILNEWEARERAKVLADWEADNQALKKENRPNKADVTITNKSGA